MLKGVPTTVSPELMQVLMSMGHGDELVIADGNFPADSHAQRLVRCDGLAGLPVIAGILKFLPVDTFVDEVAMVMQPVEMDVPEPPIWDGFRRELQRAEQRKIELTQIERFAFYERAKKAYAIVATSETALYANLILKKGVVAPA